MCVRVCVCVCESVDVCVCARARACVCALLCARGCVRAHRLQLFDFPSCFAMRAVAFPLHLSACGLMPSSAAPLAVLQLNTAMALVPTLETRPSLQCSPRSAMYAGDAAGEMTIHAEREGYTNGRAWSMLPLVRCLNFVRSFDKYTACSAAHRPL